MAAEPVLRREFARTVAFIRQWRDGGRLLEIGCAYGFFLHEVKEYFDVSGIELAADAAIYCQRSGLSVLRGVADETTLHRDEKVDVIVMLDVIEHLPDPRGTLVLLSRHLGPRCGNWKAGLFSAGSLKSNPDYYHRDPLIALALKFHLRGLPGFDIRQTAGFVSDSNDGCIRHLEPPVFLPPRVVEAFASIVD